MSVEYELDQHYNSHIQIGTPFVPNNTQYHYLQIVPAGHEREIHIFAFYPCAKPFCFLHENLRNKGFRHYYKVIQGSVTVREHQRSYDFKEAVFDGGIIALTVAAKNQFSVSTYKGFPEMQQCYQSGICSA